jgi:hypothetical protein
MSTAQAGKLILQGAKNKATDVVDFAKILFKIDRAPTDVRVSLGDDTFGKLYGQAFFEQPFRNVNLYEKQEDVLNAVALGKISQSYGATVLRDKFNIKGLISVPKGKLEKSPQYLGDTEDKFKKMLASYINNNPAVQQEYEDLIFYGNLLKETGFKGTGGSLRITKPGYLNRAIDKAMDPNYLKEYGELPFRFKYMNALKDTIDPNASIYSLSPVAFSNALKQGEQIAKARGLDVNFFPPKAVANPTKNVKGERYQIEPYATVNNGRTILPASLFAARQAKKAEKVTKSTQEFLDQFQIGERLDTGLFEFITPLRMRIKGNEGKTFYQLKDDLMLRTAGNQQRMDQINRLFEGQRNVVALDHIQPQRFGGTNDPFNLRYIMESGHFSGLRQTAKESDDLTFFVNKQGNVVSRNFVSDKTNLENVVYKKTMEIVDLVAEGKTGYLEKAEKLSDDIFFLVDNFKKVNPSVDFSLGVPYVPVKSGEKTITYIPYFNHLKLNQKKIMELTSGDKPLLQIYENLPNAGDSLQKSFDKVYDRLAPFIIEGKKLTEKDRQMLFEMKARGGAVGLQDGGEPAQSYGEFKDSKEYKELLNSGLLTGSMFGVLPSDDMLGLTPEQVIERSDMIRLQGLENDIKEKANELKNDPLNMNLSEGTRQYLISKDAYRNYVRRFAEAGYADLAVRCQLGEEDEGVCLKAFPKEQYPDRNRLLEQYKAIEKEYLTGENAQRNFANYLGGVNGEFERQGEVAKAEIMANNIQRLPLNVADFVLDIYQMLSPPGIIAGETKNRALIRKGGSVTREELEDLLKEVNEGVSDEFIKMMVKDALVTFDAGVGTYANVSGEVKDEFNRQVFLRTGAEPGREPTFKEKAFSYGISGLGVLPLVTKPTYAGKLFDILGRDDIGTFGKAIRFTPAALGIPTLKDAQGILRLFYDTAKFSITKPIKIYVGAGRYLNATVKPGTEDVFIVGSKTLPELGLALPAEELAKRQMYKNVLKNTSALMSLMASQEVTKQKKIEETEYLKLKTQELLEPKYTDQIKHYYQDAIRSQLANPDDVPFPDTKDIEYITNLPFDPEETPDWVIRYARELADAYIKKNNLKTNTLRDTLFYDMKNKKTDEKKEDDVVDIVEDVPPGLAMGGDPGQFTDPLRTPDDSAVDIRDIQESPAYMGLDELDLFEDAKLKPTKESALPEVQVANVVFGKAPGWAIAGANKIDDLLRGGNTGIRIAQSDKIADAATSAGEKINRFYSNLEARLIDPNAPEVFNTPADLFNFLQSKGISKFEVEDYQIPQLLETVSKTGQPITKAALLDRVKNAPIRKIQTKVQGFRSEVENADGQFVRGKYADSYYEGGAIPETYRENILYLDPADIPDDIQYYKYSTHGFFPDDETKYVIGWTRGTDRYAIIPGTKTQLPNIGPKTEELNKRIERLTAISNRSAEDLVNQSGGRITLEQAQTNINRAGRDLAKAQEELANIGKTDDAVVTGDQTVRVTFADEIQSDIMQTYRKKLEEVIGDYNKLVEKGIDVKDTQKLRQESYRLGMSTDQDILAFYAKHKDIMRPLFRTEEDFAAYIKELKESQQVFKDLAQVRPGMLTGEMRKGVAAAAKQRDKVLEIFEQAYTDPKTMKKLFPNVPMKDRKVWGDALVKNDLHMAAKRKFIDKDPNASDWYVVSPAELVTARYGQKGTTATPFAERTKDMKGIGQYEFYGGPNVTDPNGKHYTSVLEQSLRRAAKVNNADFKVVKIQIGEAKSVSRSVQVVNAQGDVVKEFKMAKSAKQSDFADVMDKARDYITESGAEGLIARPVELPSGFPTVDAYAIKLTPEMVLSTKTHLASGGYVQYDPLVSMDEMIGAA